MYIKPIDIAICDLYSFDLMTFKGHKQKTANNL